MTVAALAAFALSAAAALESAGSHPGLADYSAHAREVVLGRVTTVESAGRGVCASASKGLRHEFGLSRAVVHVERALYNAAPGDKVVYFCDSIRLAGDKAPRSVDEAWDLPAFHHFACGLPLSMKPGERVLLYLRPSSDLRWDYVFSELADGRAPRRLARFARERGASYFVYATRDSDGLGAKFSVEGTSGAERAVGQPSLRLDLRTGSAEVTGSDSWLWEGKKPAGHGPELRRALRSPPPAGVPLKRALSALEEAKAAALAAPEARVDYATGWGGELEPVTVEFGFTFANHAAQRLTYRLESARVLGAPKSLAGFRFAVGDEPGWDGILEPYRTATASARGKVQLEGKDLPPLRIRVAVSDGRSLELDSRASRIKRF